MMLRALSMLSCLITGKEGMVLVLKVMLSALNYVFTFSSAALPTSSFGTVEGR